MQFIRQTYESLIFAFQALRSNLLRTTLSLLGVTVGIFAIIGVFTIVDSLERNIKESLSEIGDRVVYVQKWPWAFGGEFQWWKYFQWPETNYSDYRYLADRVEGAEAIVAMDFKGRQTVKNGSNSIDALIQGVTFEYNIVSEVAIEQGRYFMPQEIDKGRKIAIIGADIAEALFPNIPDPAGQLFKINGLRYTVLGVQKKKGKGLFDIAGNPDTKVIIPYASFAQTFQSSDPSVDIVVKGRPDDTGLVELEAEITGLLRTKRGIKPSKTSNFSINRPEAAAKAVSGLFGVITLAGWVIGSFSILVGGFGIANIMFVSVKERTNLIGIQKSLGAKNYFILFQFLFEAIFLSLIGGLVGIFLVYLLSFAKLGSLDIVLSSNNITLGLGVASIIGVISGIVPAYNASRMDPVEAIRAK
ncbi:MAG: FtsX-like permease family protein [Runella slithyformis]|jgi:putative ABC transport system permease protein|nr:MAG: FtsX-like permease family protein [Runella slithyformis]TAF95362.1 MAG: FtsX-like permease family protein [Runella sp.]TAG18751.1 MAG: FtsX-like permease family protein [Cytophagales bacterium]TAG38058.1 MAG: FtsX-like permease family protein [Cytophagia bacterium]TAE99002.1 MAG: FtsX-like permease family protein [Runella slithyformis]